MKKVIVRAACFVFLVSLACSAGCDRGKEKENVSNFVMSYCSVLQLVYDRADLNLMRTFATENEIKRNFPVILALKTTESSMKTEILEFKVKKVAVADDKATVNTEEKWRFWWQEMKTGVIIKPRVEESYRLEYNLVKVDGKWKVDFIKNRNE